MKAFEGNKNIKNLLRRLRTWTGRRISLPLLLFLGLLSCTFSEGLPDLNADQLYKMMNDGTGALVVDTRSQVEFVRGRIPRAILIQEEKFFALELLLPPVKETPLVFYCRGYG